MATSISFRVHNVYFDMYLTQSLFQDHMMAALTPSVTSAFNQKKKKKEKKKGNSSYVLLSRNLVYLRLFCLYSFFMG